MTAITGDIESEQVTNCKYKGANCKNQSQLANGLVVAITVLLSNSIRSARYWQAVVLLALTTGAIPNPPARPDGSSPA